ncbi:MAG TPA: hypothetical protein VMD09_06545 [Solirubrobacteraceae bacterium]|nr:hypothetical protein [Solirubrobacteraceae bacterium]
MHDDWRLTNTFHEESNAHRMSERLEAKELEHDLETSFSERVIVSRDGAKVFCYAGSGPQAKKAEKLIRSLADEHDWHVESKLERWHPEEERWEDSETSLSRGAEHARRIESEREESRQEGYPEWEVKVQCRSHHDARQLSDQLAEEEIPCLRRWHYLLIGATDEDSAKELAKRIGAEAPLGATETVEISGRAMLDMVDRSGLNPFVAF